MTQTRFELILSVMAMVGGLAMWAAAWNLCGPAGRQRLALGLPLDRLRALGRHRGRHESGKAKDVLTYDGERVRGARRAEGDRAAEYEAMIAAELAAVASVSAAPLVEFTQELRRLTESDGVPVVPDTLAALREVVMLHDELARVEASYRQRIDAAVARATGTRAVVMVPA
jgi:hypothetical protein